MLPVKRLSTLLLSLLLISGTGEAVIPAPQSIRHQITDSPPPEQDGGYVLRLTHDEAGQPRWQVSSTSESGYFYAEQTRRQLEAEYGENLPQTLEIVDYPKLSWRGLHVDVSRHFFTVSELKAFMDRMAALKLNRLHLHLTDGPGWRLQINSYPNLTRIGAWRRENRNPAWYWPDTRIGSDFEEVYGGYFTQQDMRELIDYGRERFITIVPEIDIPGHSYAALCAYPELAQEDFDKLGNGLRGCDTIDVDKPSTEHFFKTVFDEIITLLPKGTPIHIGGDEVPEYLISTEKQRLWSQNLVEYLAEKGRKAITWDESAINGVTGQTVMLWRADMLDTVLALGLPVILTPNSHCYFDFPQRDSELEPLAMGNKAITLRDVFDMKLPDNSLVVGLQANLWTEYIRGYDHLLYMAFPRAAALAERAWGSPRRPFADFRQNLDCHPDFVPPPFTREDQLHLFGTQKTLTPAEMLRHEEAQEKAREKALEGAREKEAESI